MDDAISALIFLSKLGLYCRVQLVFLKAKIRHFGVLSALVKDSRQFIQHEKRLLKVVTACKFTIIYRQTTIYNSKKLYFVVRRLTNVGEAAGTPKMAETIVEPILTCQQYHSNTV
jgi:hypothetical protein